jgi:hypothetical protein
MTLFAITNYHWHIYWMTCFIQFVRLISILALTTGNPVYLISTKAARRVWPVSRGCLLLRGTWSYLRICRRSVLPYTRFCNCLLITITFYTLLTSLFCIHRFWQLLISPDLRHIGIRSQKREMAKPTRSGQSISGIEWFVNWRVTPNF